MVSTNQMLLALFLFATSSALANSLPDKYTELLKYVQEAPDQGETNACLFVSSTGAMELIANKKNGIEKPESYGPYDLAESFLMHAPSTSGGSWMEVPIRKFNKGFGIHVSSWPFEAWDDAWNNRTVWNYQDWSQMKQVSLPKVETQLLFMVGKKWATNVLNDQHIQKIKEALWMNKAPVLVNYNDNDYWHVIMIVGYDDQMPGVCYEITDIECRGRLGSFYVRDNFGSKVELRDYDWFRVKGNAAVLVKEAQ